jgi:tRNA threonylcarbamoyladenosine biosynthesis protein TsaE
MNKTITTKSPEETIDLGARLAEKLSPGSLLALIGELGSGKTIFAKGVAKGLGVKDYLYVNSASFVVLKEYHGRRDLYHFDVYRLEERDFCDTLDYKKYFYSDGITVVEWADKIEDILPDEYIEVKIEYGEGDERKFSFCPVGEKLKNVVDNIS